MQRINAKYFFNNYSFITRTELILILITNCIKINSCVFTRWPRCLQYDASILLCDTIMDHLTRKLCYRKDDRAMRLGCPENVWDSLTTPTATFLKILWTSSETSPDGEVCFGGSRRSGVWPSQHGPRRELTGRLARSGVADDRFTL